MLFPVIISTVWGSKVVMILKILKIGLIKFIFHVYHIIKHFSSKNRSSGDIYKQVIYFLDSVWK